MSKDAVDLTQLAPGDPHYTAYVGPPLEYDFMGATQFHLLCTLGMRAGHRVLDFGCGSLRAGRFLMMYLDPGNYYGIEPNAWLIEDAIRQQVGRDLLAVKRPTFDHSGGFRVDHLKTKFDFILAQSILSHTHRELAAHCLRQFAAALNPSGRIAVTFVEGESDPAAGEGWVYPDIVCFRRETIESLISAAGLLGCRIPWYHRRQTWYVLARDAAVLPTPEMFPHLRGAVLFDQALERSWKAPEDNSPRGPFWRLRSRLKRRPSAA
jgi:SAM-dependent methyltransferase